MSNEVGTFQPFNSTPDLQRVALEEKNKAAVSMLLKNVSSALIKKGSGDSTEYNKLLDLFNKTPSSMLGVWFSALSQCASLVTQHGQDIISAIFQYNFEENNETTLSFLDFMANTALVNHSMMGNVFHKLIQSFTQTNPDIFHSQQQMDFYFGSIQATLSKITSISPSSSTLLFNKLVELYPHKSQPLFVQEIYLNNLLFISKKYPILREKIITLVIDKLIQIDVEIIDEEEEEDLMFELDASQTNEQASQKEMADKLDSLLFLMFTFLEQTVFEGKKEVTNEIFEILLKSFDKSLLPSSSKFTQFLIFFLCSKDPNYSQKFLAHLFSKVLTVTQFNHMGSYSPKLFAQSSGFAGQYSVKESCILYAGSFIARMKFIPLPTASHSCTLLANWAVKYIEQNPLAHPDVSSHSLFYLITHCLLYILCFKLDDLLDTFTRDELLQNLRLSTIVQCKLNPLKVCPKSVVKEFIASLKDKKILDFASNCETILYRVTNYLTPSKVPEKYISLENHVDLKYPFDPYPFPKSVNFIDPIYINWKGDAKANIEKDESSEDEEEDSHNSSSSCKHSTSFSDDDLAMSFTPDTAFDIEYHFSQSFSDKHL